MSPEKMKIKITDDLRKAIIKDLRKNKHSMDIAVKYGITQQQVSGIKAWVTIGKYNLT